MKKRFTISLLSVVSFLNLTRAQTFDICVYRGTSAGVIAAYTAAKAGKKLFLWNQANTWEDCSGGLGQTDIGNKYAITGIA